MFYILNNFPRSPQEATWYIRDIMLPRVCTSLQVHPQKHSLTHTPHRQTHYTWLQPFTVHIITFYHCPTPRDKQSCDPHLWKGKGKLKEARCLSQGHAGSKQKSQTGTQVFCGLLIPSSVCLFLFCPRAQTLTGTHTHTPILYRHRCDTYS